MNPKHHSFILFVADPDGRQIRAGAQIKYFDGDLQEIARWATMNFEKEYPGYNVIAAIYISGDYTLDDLAEVDPFRPGTITPIFVYDKDNEEVEA